MYTQRAGGWTWIAYDGLTLSVWLFIAFVSCMQRGPRQNNDDVELSPRPEGKVNSKNWTRCQNLHVSRAPLSPRAELKNAF